MTPRELTLVQKSLGQLLTVYADHRGEFGRVTGVQGDPQNEPVVWFADHLDRVSRVPPGEVTIVVIL